MARFDNRQDGEHFYCDKKHSLWHIKIGSAGASKMNKFITNQHAMISHSNSAYRPDIDGLRAISVLAVIGFHANAQMAPGGFSGVDVFFVISGFLISGLIYKGVERGTFSFSDFYARRIKRILPAYIVVAFFTLAVSTYLFIPNDYIFYTTSLAASWAFSANVFFSMLSWGYFGRRTEEFPLLHTWSLSVEEQFYFIFPILFIVLLRYFRHATIWILLVFTAIFTGISELKTGNVGAYFLLPYRTHELTLGVLTFFLLKKYPLRSRWMATLLAATGVALVLGAVFILKRGLSFPGFNSLFPCIGAALLIYSCDKDNPIAAVLKSRPLVFIGLISYSLYLWHWPIFSFLRYRRIELTFWVSIAAIALSFTLAFLTWKFVEAPIRSDRKIDFKNAFARFYIMPATLFAAVGLGSYITEGLPQRFPDDIRQLISSYSFERDLTRSCSIRSQEYHEITLNYLLEHCAFGDLSKPDAAVLLFGDSHAHHFKPFVEELAKDAQIKSIYHVEGSCSAIDLFEEGAVKGATPTACQQRNANLLDMAGKFRFVVIASFWSYKGREPLFQKKLELVIRKIIAAGATPVIFKDNPYYEPDLSQCILFQKRGWQATERNCSIPYGFVYETQGSMNKVIDAVKSRYPRMIVIDPKIVMCNAVECATNIGNTALYKDANHINLKAALLLAERYREVAGNPFVYPSQ
jgi:peptidoglycan/LPS O-acetylase OafA/YrhL